jgi:Protein of unknown function (DUF2752)
VYPRIVLGDRLTRRPRSLARVLLSPWSLSVAFAVLGLSIALPIDGFGLPALTGLPCVGCGLTRSVTAVSHLQLADAVHFHPFGPLVYALALVLVGLVAAGRQRRLRFARWLTRHDKRLRPAYLGLVAAFLTFGVARLLLAIVDPSLTAHL